MNKEEYKKQEEKELDEEYKKFLSRGITLEEWIEEDKKKQFAIELEQDRRYRENTQRMLNNL